MRNVVATSWTLQTFNRNTPRNHQFSVGHLGFWLSNNQLIPSCVYVLDSIERKWGLIIGINNLQNPMCFADWFNVEKPPTEIKWEERNLFFLYCLLGIRNRIGPQGKIYLFGIEIESSTDHDNLSWEVLRCHQWLWWIVMTCDQAVKGWRSPFPQGWSVWRRAMMVKFPRKCSGNAHCWSSFGGVFWGQVLISQKGREFDLIVLTVAIVYIDWVCGNAFVNVACRIFANCDLSLLPLYAEFHVPSTLPRVPFA